MAFDSYKNYPWGALTSNHACKEGEGIEAGDFVVLNSDGLLQLAVGAAGEYAMIATSDQPLNFVQNGGKIQVVKENASLRTTSYKADESYVSGGKLQVSTNAGLKGKLIPHEGGGSPVVGRFREFILNTLDNKSYLVFDLVRD